MKHIRSLSQESFMDVVRDLLITLLPLLLICLALGVFGEFSSIVTRPDFMLMSAYLFVDAWSRSKKIDPMHPSARKSLEVLTISGALAATMLAGILAVHTEGASNHYAINDSNRILQITQGVIWALACITSFLTRLATTASNTK